MSSILIATVPVHGHVTPLLAVARHFVERGDRVRFLTGSRFARVVEETGAEHLPLPAEIDFDDRRDFNEVFPERAALKGTKALAHDIEHVFVRPGLAQHDAVMASHAAEPADAILADPAFIGGAFLLGHPLGVRPPVVMCSITALPISSRDTAPFGMGLTPLRGPLGRLRNALLAMITNKVVFSSVERLADQIFHRLHGRSIPFAVLEWPRHANAIVQFTVPEFEYPRSDAPATLHFAGPISASGSQAPLPPWWHELDGSRPVVHLTQGTIANKDFGQLIAPALEGLADEDLLVAVATGGRPVESLPPLPANARAAEFLPYDDLLPKDRRLRHQRRVRRRAVRAAATACRSWQSAAAMRTSPKSWPESPGPVSGVASRPRTRHRPRSATPSGPCSTSPGTATPHAASLSGWPPPAAYTDSPRSSTT